jgi:hypothetical protein
MKACEELRAKINREARSPRTLAELVSHYREKELTEVSGKAFSTRTAYTIYLRNWIVPEWGERLLSDVRTVTVEEWLYGLSLSNGSKAKIRNLMSALFNHAMRYEWTERNPIKLVRQSAKRERVPEVLTAEEIKALLSQLDGPYYVMASLAALTGLRVSELTALTWEDIDFNAGEIHLTRAIVCQHVGSLKTERHGNRFQWTRDCPRCCWTGVAAALTIKTAIMCSPRLRCTALNRCGHQARCRNTSDPLRSGPASRNTFAGTYSDTRSQLS